LETLENGLSDLDFSMDCAEEFFPNHL